jgi:uncharacterized membrane protein YjfL (UPF0719 family)
MKTRALFRLAALSLVLTPTLLTAADAAPAPTWHAQSLGQALIYMLLFAGVGIVAAIAGYKIFDKCTPGHLNTEILEHRNVAAAIIAAAVTARNTTMIRPGTRSKPRRSTSGSNAK